MTLLDKDTIKKGEINENVIKLDVAKNSSGYEIEAIWNSAVYIRESKSGYVPGLYYLVFWKRYLEEKNIYESILAVQYFKKLISSFYKNHLNKLTTIFMPINILPSMAKPTIKLTALN